LVGGELGVEEFFAPGAEDAFGEEPVDGVDERLLAYPERLGVLVEPVGGLYGVNGSVP
jgi:hypothetical protein